MRRKYLVILFLVIMVSAIIIYENQPRIVNTRYDGYVRAKHINPPKWLDDSLSYITYIIKYKNLDHIYVAKTDKGIVYDPSLAKLKNVVTSLHMGEIKEIWRGNVTYVSENRMYYEITWEQIYPENPLNCFLQRLWGRYDGA